MSLVFVFTDYSNNVNELGRERFKVTPRTLNDFFYLTHYDKSRNRALISLSTDMRMYQAIR